ncbi:MAG TPA: hypothetical protein PKC39_13975 [Ferruginibacter sp.]|nr:hypothetical protein [Ferruginibacter sp.]HMP22064.1 hypothetical protein [Ferruginibacter sp.]
MSIIKYKNVFGEVLTEQQTQADINFYTKEFYDSGTLKKVEHYHKGLNPKIVYYMSDDEVLATVVLDIKNQYGGGSLYFNKQVTGSYTVWDWEFYDGLTIIEKGKEVLDNQNREIAHQELDLISLEVLKTTKKYYIEDLGEFAEYATDFDTGILKFDYNMPHLEIGEISVEVNLPGFELDIYTISQTENILLDSSIATIFTWADHPYYHNASPLIPS